MRIKLNENKKDSINTLIIDEIYTDKEEKVMFQIIFEIVEKENIFLNLYRSNIYELEEDEIINKLNYYERYFKINNQQYEYVEFKDTIRFKALATFNIENNTIKELKNIWRTYGEIAIFKPNKNFSWNDFLSQYKKDRNKLKINYYIKNGYTNMCLEKTMDNDALIIIYNNKIDTQNLLDKINEKISHI